MKIKTIKEVKNKKDFKKYMKPYGNHVSHILGNYYEILNVNTKFDMYEIRKYDEPYYKKNTLRLYVNACKPIEKIRVGADECVKLILKEIRKEKLEKINNNVI